MRNKEGLNDNLISVTSFMNDPSNHLEIWMLWVNMIVQMHLSFGAIDIYLNDWTSESKQSQVLSLLYCQKWVQPKILKGRRELLKLPVPRKKNLFETWSRDWLIRSILKLTNLRNFLWNIILLDKRKVLSLTTIKLIIILKT